VRSLATKNNRDLRPKEWAHNNVSGRGCLNRRGALRFYGYSRRTIGRGPLHHSGSIYVTPRLAQPGKMFIDNVLRQDLPRGCEWREADSACLFTGVNEGFVVWITTIIQDIGHPYLPREQKQFAPGRDHDATAWARLVFWVEKRLGPAPDE
jgi:hypothetical protein